MSARVTAEDRPSSRTAERGVAVGFLALLPLFVAYECALAPDGPRNTAERVLALPIARVGLDVPLARAAILAALALLALATLFRVRSELALLPRLVRIVGEGLAWGAVLGPLLLLVLRVARLEPPVPELAAAAEPSAARLRDAALLCGGAAHEEIVFRVGIQSLAFLALSALCRAVSAGAKLRAFVAETGSVAAGAAAFATAHLGLAAAFVHARGEPFELRVFTWRAAAGILLAVLFRWRGVGVAAWAHAGLDLALFLGAGPHVFL
ncbi:MAG: hypothetical protein ACKVWV_10155 [Planctomycetota bacterium]